MDSERKVDLCHCKTCQDKNKMECPRHIAAWDMRLLSEMAVDPTKYMKIMQRISKEWRIWHGPEFGDFPHDELITAMHELDELFPGKKAGADE